jgi:4a-hydroxytetrahydrobiopterin dehydratase
MSGLTQKTCKPCEGGVKPLSADESRTMLEQLNGWTFDDDSKIIQQDFVFKNYYQTMAFVNAMAWIAHQEDHHPDIEVGYNHCLINYSTHAIGGLSENDFICAAKIDALLASNTSA